MDKMDILIAFVALGAVATISCVIYNKSKKSNSGNINEWVSQDQREESYKKTIEDLIRNERWEDLEHFKITLVKYPRLIQKIEEALRNRKN